MKQQTQTNKIEWKQVDFLDSIEEEASSNKLKIPQKEFLESGKYPIIDQGERFIAGYTDDGRKVYDKNLPVVIFGDHTRILKFVNFYFALGADGIKVLVPKKEINAKYLFYAIKKLNLKSLGYSRHYKLLKEKIIPVPFSNGKPDLEEQNRIVQILENAEKLKERGKKANDLLDEYLKSVFHEMFRSYLVDKNKLKKITDFVNADKNAIKAGPFGSSLKKDWYVDNGYKIYGQEQVIKNDLNFGDYYISSDKYKELENYKVQEGDILISLVGTYGKISIVPKQFQPGIINPRLMKITLDKQKMNPIFFRFLFLSDIIVRELQNFSHGGTMDIVNVGIVKRIGFPLPPLLLQQKFARIVEQVEKLKENVAKSNLQSEDLFNSLMHKAFRGELL